MPASWTDTRNCRQRTLPKSIFGSPMQWRASVLASGAYIQRTSCGTRHREANRNSVTLDPATRHSLWFRHAGVDKKIYSGPGEASRPLCGHANAQQQRCFSALTHDRHAGDEGVLHAHQTCRHQMSATCKCSLHSKPCICGSARPCHSMNAAVCCQVSSHGSCAPRRQSRR